MTIHGRFTILIELIFSFNYNYGHSGLLDWLHGTDSLFKKSVEGERDGRLYTLQSAREIFPQKPKEKVK